MRLFVAIISMRANVYYVLRGALERSLLNEIGSCTQTKDTTHSIMRDGCVNPFCVMYVRLPPRILHERNIL